MSSTPQANPDPRQPRDFRQRQQEQAELFLGNLLRVGILASFLFIIGGLMVIFYHHPDYFTDPAQRQNITTYGTAFPVTPSEVLRDLGRSQERALVTLGVLLLILTPILRVVASALIFAIQRDRIYFLLTYAVLLVLCISFLLGKAG